MTTTEPTPEPAPTKEPDYLSGVVNQDLGGGVVYDPVDVAAYPENPAVETPEEAQATEAAPTTPEAPQAPAQ